MKNRLCMTFASLFHIGFIPGAPGTYASLTTTVIFFLVSRWTGISTAAHLSAVIVITAAGILASSQVSRSSGNEDPSFVVIDEVAGQLLTFLFLPATIFNLILGFIAFRVFDMWKPFPIRQAESLGGGVGIMADDLAAGIFGSVLLHLINRFF